MKDTKLFFSIMRIFMYYHIVGKIMVRCLFDNQSKKEST